MDLYTQDPEKPGPGLADDPHIRQTSLAQLLRLASEAAAKPALALGIGQVLHMFFWWGGQETLDTSKRPTGPNIPVVAEAVRLQEVALDHGGYIHDCGALFSSASFSHRIKY